MAEQRLGSGSAGQRPDTISVIQSITNEPGKVAEIRARAWDGMSSTMKGLMLEGALLGPTPMYPEGSLTDPIKDATVALMSKELL